MARGRKGQPAEVKDAKGNPGNRPNKAASTDALPEDKGGAPAHLKAEAKKIWAALAPHLQRSKLMRVTDRNAFARYCQSLADYWEATRQLGTNGHVYDAPMTNGGTMKRINPWFGVQDRIGRRLENLEDRFGLSPRSRQEVMFRMASLGATPPPLPAGDDELPLAQPDSAAKGPVGFLNNARPPTDAVN